MVTIRRIKRGASGNVIKGLAAGLIGGLVASWTMNRFQDLWFKTAKASRTLSDNQFQDVWGEVAVQESPATETTPEDKVEDDTTVRAASAVSEGLFNHKLTVSEKKIAGPAVHYTLGTGVGGLYGAAAELVPSVTAGAGLPFGAAFWLVVDEGAVPLLGLSKGPTSYPLSTHVYALSSHFVYGITAEMVRRAVRRAM
jgi:hypothetical protein